MKKLFVLLVSILAFTNVTSCGGPRPSESDNQVKITATEKTTTTETTKATEFDFQSFKISIVGLILTVRYFQILVTFVFVSYKMIKMKESKYE